jgi:hypothetical protein
MSKKTFAGAPKPARQPSAEEIERFETSGKPPSAVGTETQISADTHSQVTANPETRNDANLQERIHGNTEIPEGGNTLSSIPANQEEAIVRLTIDLPESMHTRFKAVCAATRRKMVQEVRTFIELRTCELESEADPG